MIVCIGAGPGSLEYITQRGADLVRSADVVAGFDAGVNMVRPLIAPGASFDYVSGCPLDTPSGAMSGNYRMVDEDGSAFEVEIPRFQLLSA